jgi:hypothetical protein
VPITSLFEGTFMKRSRAAAAVAAGLMAAVTGVVGAGTASAASPRSLCVANHPECATVEGATSTIWMLSTGGDSWLYNVPLHPGQIQLDGTGYCMQLDHEAGNTVIFAACNGANYQRWDGFDSGSGTEGFISAWNTSLCLTYNESKNYLDAVTCDGKWYQAFAPFAG